MTEENLQRSTRTQKYLGQLRATALYKGLAVGMSFLSTPLLLQYLGAELYGIWVTLLSVIVWVVQFDLGIGNGVRNEVTLSVLEDNFSATQSFISTAYVTATIFSLLVYALFFVFGDAINWTDVFNTKNISHDEIFSAVNYALIGVLANFVLSLALHVFSAIHRAEMSVIFQLVFNATSVVLVFISCQFLEGDLHVVAFIYAVSMVFSGLILNWRLFTESEFYVPKPLFFQLSKVRAILGFGAKFFIIQIFLLVILSTDKILISQIFSPSDVVPYDVVFKLFTLVLVLQNLVLAPMWASFTDAYKLNDVGWMRDSVKTLLAIMVPLAAGVVALGVFTPWIVRIWIGSELPITGSLIVAVSSFVLVLSWNNIFGTVANAVSELKVQLICYFLGALTNIPLSLLFTKYFGLGPEGVVWASVASLAIFSICGALHVRGLLSKGSKGIRSVHY